MKPSLLIGTILLLAACNQGGIPGLSLSPQQGAALSVPAGGSAQENLQLSSLHGINGTVQLSYQVRQGGKSVSGFNFSPSSVTRPNSSPLNLQIRVSVSAQVAPGTYQVQVTAQEGGASSQAGFQVQVSSALSLTGATALSVSQGSSGSESLSLSSQDSSGTVQLSYQVSENGASLPSSGFSFSPTTVNLSAGKPVQIPLKVQTPSNLAGHDQVKVTATLSGMSTSATFPLTVTGEQVIHNFSGNYDAYPYASLIKGSNGDLYGTTIGTYNAPKEFGTTFQLAQSGNAWAETVLHIFQGATSDGAQPFAPLIFGSNGDLYGTTENGGANYKGTVFQLAQSGGSWTETVLYSFSSSSGAFPQAPLILGSNGDLYGTTSGSGSGTNGNGTVFQLAPPSSPGGNWTETVLHSFQGGSDGATPLAALIQGSNGDLYGTTEDGGTNGDGTVFQLAQSGGAWTETVLHSFGSGSDGFHPLASLIKGSNGDLYGTTAGGGANSYGTVFQISPSGAETVIYSFNSSSGAFPQAPLILGSNGDLYGTTFGTYNGGANNVGTVFQLAPPSSPGGTWTGTVLHSFQGGADGANPVAALIQGSNGDLYGTTEYGGASGEGTVFKVVP
jgi:uncharacterized repeat protein (TIGR03803 family)